MEHNRDEQRPPGPLKQAASPAGERTSSGLDRRKFLGALGVTAAAGVFLESGGRAEGANQSTPPPPVLYQDSFGNVGPANPAALAAGIVPLPVPSQQSPNNPLTTHTYVTQGYKQPNFLMIMVDQMGVPRWLPPGGSGQQTIDGLTPNIVALRKSSCVFPNYFTAATACTPARATLLTGLYSQQTCILNTLENWCEPELIGYDDPNNPGIGFPTIGDVLAQALPIQGGGTSPGYDTVWIGKWHLSAVGTGGKETCGIGVTPGPTPNYGFNDIYSIPNNQTTNLYNPLPGAPLAYPSPDGSAANEGVGGALVQPVSGDTQHYGTTFVYEDYASQSPDPCNCLNLGDPGYLALGDGGIADAFVNTWLPYALNHVKRPWFCAVSFINPHDLSGFPYGYGLANTSDFGPPPAGLTGYIPPPQGGFNWPGQTDESIPPFPNPVPYLPGNPPVGWNNGDDPSMQAYAPPVNGVYGKPTLQWVYHNQSIKELGQVLTTNGWLTFLNYYYWMQYTVDVQVGGVLKALGNSPFASNTIILFLSDHGDYAGSHSIHGKAFGLYDETINVPLYIQVLQTQKAMTYPYMCSSVDILPFLYDMALGNHSWRTNPNDLVGYLNGREAISDFIYSSSPAQRRVSTIPCAMPGHNGAGAYQPYVLHTTDEGWGGFTSPKDGTTPVSGHAIAFRTVDYSVGPPYGGGKLGMYSFWNYTLGDSDGIPPTQPDPNTSQGGGPQQFEFYNYSSGQSLPANYGEFGNQVQISGGMLTGQSLAYLQSFSGPNGIAQSELYPLSHTNSGFPSYITGAYTKALQTYLNYVAAHSGTNSSFTTWQT